MTYYYRESDPSDLRPLGDTYERWIAEGNPKASAWIPAPPKPSEDAIWNGSGFWIMPAASVPPNWSRFKAALVPSGSGNDPIAVPVNAALVAAFPLAPVAVVGIAPALAKAEAGDPGEFGACWSAICAAVPFVSGTLPLLESLAAACNLPEDFRSCLAPPL